MISTRYRLMVYVERWERHIVVDEARRSRGTWAGQGRVIALRAAHASPSPDRAPQQLGCRARGRSTPKRLARPAQMVRLGAHDKRNRAVAAEVGVGRVTVAQRRARFAPQRPKGIEKGAPRGGGEPARRRRMATVTVGRTRKTQPAHALRRSTRPMGRELGVSSSMVFCVRRASRWRPHPIDYLVHRRRGGLCTGD